MPEAAPAAPAANTTTPNAPPQPGAKSTPPTQPTAQEAVSQWTADDDKAFEALAKKRGLKVKANGQETPITSIEALMKEFEFSSKGRGATKLAEEAKKEREAAAAERAEAARLKQLHEAARKGDYKARVELGLVAPDEASAREAELSALPPEVRQVLEEREQLRAELETLRAEQEKAQQEAARQRDEANKATVRRQASEYVTKVLDAAHLDLKTDADEARPFLSATYQAMREFAEAGLDLSQDTTSDMVVRRALELRQEVSEKSFSKLKPQRRIELARPVLEGLAAEVFGEFDAQGKQVKAGSGNVQAIIDSVGMKSAVAIARAVAQMQRGQKAAAQKPATPAPPEQKEQPRKPEPLRFGSPYLGGGR